MNYKDLTPITREDYKKVHNDYKWVIKWVPHMLQNNNWATVSVPVIFVTTFEKIRSKYNSITNVCFISDNINDWVKITDYFKKNYNFVVDGKKIKELWFQEVIVWVLKDNKWINIHWVYSYNKDIYITEDALLKYSK